MVYIPFESASPLQREVVASLHHGAPVRTPAFMGVRLFSSSKSPGRLSSILDGLGRQSRGLPRSSCEIAFGREKAPPVTDSFGLGAPKGARTGTPAKAADSHQAKRCRGGNTRLGRATLDRRLFVPNP